MSGRVLAMMERLKPVGGMVLVQLVFAGVNIFYKLALNDGMDAKILVAYRYLFAAASLGPLAFFIERKQRPKMTWKIMMQSFLCGLFGGTLLQNLYIAAMKRTSATFTTAVVNLAPAITFILATLIGFERFEIHRMATQAKVIGTIVGIGGVLLLTFYKGVEINLWPKSVDLLKGHKNNGGRHPAPPHHDTGNQVVGSLFALAGTFCYSLWLIIQAMMSNVYPCSYSVTALMCFMASVQSTIFALCMDRDWVGWKMGFDIRLLAVFFTGVVGSALIFTLMAWCIRMKGPLFAAVFNPLMLLIVALLESLLLDEKLHLGSILGGVLIVVGLYMVLWGKGREDAAAVRDLPAERARESVELMIQPGATTARDEGVGSQDVSELNNKEQS